MNQLIKTFLYFYKKRLDKILVRNKENRIAKNFILSGALRRMSDFVIVMIVSGRDIVSFICCISRKIVFIKTICINLNVLTAL